jgi:hypothetical protein
MADRLVDAILRVSTPPEDDDEAFNAWLCSLDGIEFLKANDYDEEFVFYATPGQTFIHTVLVPTTNVTPPNVQDLIAWSFNAYGSWGVSYTLSDTPDIKIVGPFEGDGTKSFDGGTRLIFPRDFEGRVGNKHYWEILQKFVHVFDLHYVEERNAFCRLDENGDVEDFVRILTVPGKGGSFNGTIITFRRKLLDEWMLLTDTVMVRTFEFLRRRRGFMDWADATRSGPTEDRDICYNSGVVPGQASFRRGYQIARPIMQRADLNKKYGLSREDNREYASFVAYDWKNRVVREISTAPGATANYFTESDLPFEMSPAFFKPEVLQKYKADSDKYRLEDRAIHCRGAWYLTTYDINEAGQVHTYMCYLRDLPYTEQLHWRAYNESPKASISNRALATDFKGKFHDEYDPLRSLKDILRKLNDSNVPWWTMREKAFDKVMYPITTSPDEWANEILLLDQLVVEGFKDRWLRKQAEAVRRAPAPTHRSLKLIEECLMGFGYEEQEARAITAPLHDLHYLRSKLKGHVSGEEASEIRKKTLREHGTHRKHYEALCTRCDEAMRSIAAAFQPPL